jgi:hypothetical protein
MSDADLGIFSEKFFRTRIRLQHPHHSKIQNDHHSVYGRFLYSRTKTYR